MTDIFVFGSNLSGRHGKGAALDAVNQHGAIHGVGHGRQGNAYAIPTKGYATGKRFNAPVLPLPMIQYFVKVFLIYAREHPDLKFRLTAIGCGHAGYKPAQIAPMFDHHPSNVYLPFEFLC